MDDEEWLALASEIQDAEALPLAVALDAAALQLGRLRLYGVAWNAEAHAERLHLLVYGVLWDQEAARQGNPTVRRRDERHG